MQRPLTTKLFDKAAKPPKHQAEPVGEPPAEDSSVKEEEVSLMIRVRRSKINRSAERGAERAHRRAALRGRVPGRVRAEPAEHAYAAVGFFPLFSHAFPGFP